MGDYSLKSPQSPKGDTKLAGSVSCRMHWLLTIYCEPRRGGTSAIIHPMIVSPYGLKGKMKQLCPGSLRCRLILYRPSGYEKIALRATKRSPFGLRNDRPSGYETIALRVTKRSPFGLRKDRPLGYEKIALRAAKRSPFGLRKDRPSGCEKIALRV